MFSAVSQKNMESIYGVVACSRKRNCEKCSTGTGFAILPDIIATASHNLHEDGNCRNPRYSSIEVIKTPDIGGSLKRARLVAEDTIRDLAFLRIENPSSGSHVIFTQDIVPVGTIYGSLGFPFAKVEFLTTGKSVELPLRFQSAFISAYITENRHGQNLDFYETDALMYDGSSGCPGFLVDGYIFGMHVEHRDDYAFSLWVPSADIIRFAEAHDIEVITT